MRAYRAGRPLRPGPKLVVCPRCKGLRRVRAYACPLGGPPVMGEPLCVTERDCARCGGAGEVEPQHRRPTPLGRALLFVVRLFVRGCEAGDRAERFLTGEPPRGCR